MAPRLGGKENAEMYLNFGRFPDFPKNIPWGVTQIAKLLGKFSMNDYDIIRRWEWLASFLNTFYWEWRSNKDN